MIVALAMAAVVAAQAPPAGSIATGNADDETDATCVQAVALALAKPPAGHLDNLLILNAFYIGRLTARATRPSWSDTVDREADRDLTAANIAPVIARCSRQAEAVLRPR